MLWHASVYRIPQLFVFFAVCRNISQTAIPLLLTMCRIPSHTAILNASSCCKMRSPTLCCHVVVHRSLSHSTTICVLRGMPQHIADRDASSSRKMPHNIAHCDTKHLQLHAISHSPQSSASSTIVLGALSSGCLIICSTPQKYNFFRSIEIRPPFVFSPHPTQPH